MSRPNWDTYWLSVASTIASRADCSRRQVGCVIVDTRQRIVSTGYNGGKPKGPSCLAGECPRGKHYPQGDACACGDQWPCPNAVPPGSSYDTGPGACIALHAEMNALLYAGRDKLEDATMYITHKPCDGCQKHIDATPIKTVLWIED